MARRRWHRTFLHALSAAALSTACDRRDPPRRSAVPSTAAPSASLTAIAPAPTPTPTLTPVVHPAGPVLPKGKNLTWQIEQFDAIVPIVADTAELARAPFTLVFHIRGRIAKSDLFVNASFTSRTFDAAVHKMAFPDLPGFEQASRPDAPSLGEDSLASVRLTFDDPAGVGHSVTTRPRSRRAAAAPARPSTHSIPGSHTKMSMPSPAAAQCAHCSRSPRKSTRSSPAVKQWRQCRHHNNRPSFFLASSLVPMRLLRFGRRIATGVPAPSTRNIFCARVRHLAAANGPLTAATAATYGRLRSRSECGLPAGWARLAV